ncbi:MAG TPA: DUF1559 domain-containing protein [Pirellulales bacterium]|nr:DUF1559 domain-containing protein [Pirellulales bacterium]
MAKPLTKLVSPLKPKRRWAQYSLDLMFVVVTALCAWLGAVVNPAMAAAQDSPVESADDDTPSAAPPNLRAQMSARRLLKQFRDAGGQEVFVVVSLSDVPELPPFIVVPLFDRADEQALTKVLGILPFESHRKLRGALVFGAEATLDWLASQRPAARTEVAPAFEARGEAQVLVVTTSDSRRVIEELLPTLPAEVGGPSRTLPRGARWFALGITPRLAASLTLQSQVRDSASALRERWMEHDELWGQHREVLAALSQFELILAKMVRQVNGDKFVAALDEHERRVGVLRAMVEPSVQAARQASQRHQSMYNLKQVANAMHVYCAAHKHSFAAAASYSADGKPLLSWRVQLLPYLEQGELYREFHLDEPWDSEHNRSLVERMPDVFRSPLSKHKAPDRTNYLAPVAEGTVFHGHNGIAMQEITDGTENTILVVEADDDRAVIWTKPDDLAIDLDQPQAGLGGLLGDLFLTAFADNSVHTLHVDTDRELLRHLFLRADGNEVDWNKLKKR